MCLTIITFRNDTNGREQKWKKSKSVRRIVQMHIYHKQYIKVMSLDTHIHTFFFICFIFKNNTMIKYTWDNGIHSNITAINLSLFYFIKFFIYFVCLFFLLFFCYYFIFYLLNMFSVEQYLMPNNYIKAILITIRTLHYYFLMISWRFSFGTLQ